MNILIIDDEVDICHMLQRPLKKAGHMVRFGHSVNDAFQLTSNHTYDLYVVDIHLPDGTGFDIVQKVKDQRSEIVMISAFEGEEEMVKMNSLGVNHFLKKPFKVTEVLDVVEKFSH